MGHIYSYNMKVTQTNSIMTRTMAINFHNLIPMVLTIVAHNTIVVFTSTTLLPNPRGEPPNLLGMFARIVVELQHCFPSLIALQKVTIHKY
jgi:hypothetical protein